MTKKPILMALDLGTSSVRAMLFDAQGRPLSDAESQIPYAQRVTRDGGVETDADTLLRRTVDAIQSLLKKTSSDDVDRISGVGISCFWHSLLGIDGNQRAVTPVYSWADTRSRSQISYLRERLGADYHARSGCFIHSSYWPAKLLWLAREKPQLYGRVRHWMGFGDYVLMNLLGTFGQSVSMASATGLYECAGSCWNKDVLKLLGIDESALAPIIADTATPGGLVPAYRRRIAAVSDVPWLPSFGDGACSNVGSGATDSSRFAINMGTSGALRAVTETTPDAPELFRYALDSKTNVVGGALANGGNAYAWLQHTLAPSDDLSKLVARIPPDSHGLTVLPFWAGERSPGWHSDARAVIAGLNLHSAPSEIVRATLESITYTLESVRVPLHRQIPEAKEIVASGGALRHEPAWMQMMADVFGTPVVLSRVAEASSRGAALLASRKLGYLSDLGDAAPVLGRRYLPVSKNHEVYKAAIQRYGKLYAALIDGTG